MNRIAHRASTHRPSSIHSQPRGLLSFFVLAFAYALFPSLTAIADDLLQYRPGLRNSLGGNHLTAKELDAVVKSLRDKTGFLEMRFDDNGFLMLGDRTKTVGGSASARQLLIAAVEMAGRVELEAINRSASVAFARIDNQVLLQNRRTGARLDVCSVLIDFADFAYLHGDKSALAAFDLGFVLLHELGHAVMGLHDFSADSSEPGECEEFINRIRRELDLPERQTYIAITRSTSFSIANRTNYQAELLFTKTDGKKEEKLLVSWEAYSVGPVVPVNAIAAAKKQPVKIIALSASGQ